MLAENFRLNLLDLINGYERGARSRLAEYLETSPAYVTQLCKGDVIPTLDRVEQIAKFFKVSATKLFERRARSRAG